MTRYSAATILLMDWQAFGLEGSEDIEWVGTFESFEDVEVGGAALLPRLALGSSIQEDFVERFEGFEDDEVYV